MIRVGVDVGGTFTDLVAHDDESGELRSIKVPSTPGKEHDGFLDGIQALAEGRSPPHQIVHGTTVATNSLLQRKGGEVAMLCTAGFRDVLEIGRCMRYAPNSLFDTKFVKPPPLVERNRRFEVRERMGADGKVVTPLTADAIQSAIQTLKSANPDSIAVCLINAYANDAHEQELLRRLAEALPETQICASVQVHRGYQEFERFSTTALNAFLMPPMAKYLSVLEQTLARHGVSVPILIMGSSGGTLTPRAASRFPVRTLLSGPVGGVTAARALAAICGLEEIITYDMGGTSTDVSVIRKGQALATEQILCGGLPVRGTMLDIHTVGAGAGSLAYVDSDGSLCVGPESAGAHPGPACYGSGGERATVTDANLVLGRLNPGRRLGGRIELQPARATAALQRLSRELGSLSPRQLADGIIRIAVAKMAGAIREISVSRGLDPRRFTLVSYGGSGPMHAALVSAELGIRQVIVPQMPGNFSALGLLTADLRWDASESVFSALDAGGMQTMRKAIDRLAGLLRERVAGEGVRVEGLRYEYQVEMHYLGQATSFSVHIPNPDVDAESLRGLFLAQYEERYGHANAQRPISIDAVRVVAISSGRKPDFARLGKSASGMPGAARREVYFDGKALACEVLERSALAQGFVVDGPVVIEESGSTTVVPPGWRAAIDGILNIRLTQS